MIGQRTATFFLGTIPAFPLSPTHRQPGQMIHAGSGPWVLSEVLPKAEQRVAGFGNFCVEYLSGKMECRARPITPQIYKPGPRSQGVVDER